MNFFQHVIIPLDLNYDLIVNLKLSKDYIQAIYKINHTYTSFTETLSTIGNSIPNLFPGLGVAISKTEPLLSNFYLDAMIYKSKLTLYIPKYYIENWLHDLHFSYINYYTDNNFIFTLILLFNSKLVKIALLCTTVYCMQYICGICSNNANLVYYPVRVNNYKCDRWFVNFYSYITGKSYWLYRYLHKLSYKVISAGILIKVYNNVKNILTKFHLSYNINTGRFVLFKTCLCIGSIPNVISFNSFSFYGVCAALTVVYLLLGSILDFISFIWIYLKSDMGFRSVNTLTFWYKRVLYGIIYIMWLIIGVISTNGLYFSILDVINSLSNINLIMAVLGSCVTYIFSGLWFYYGGGINPVPLNLFESIKDGIISSLLPTNYSNVKYSLFKNLLNVFYHSLIVPNSFNYYSSVRRSILEWLSFLGMVLSTYGTWNIYTIYAWNSISVLQHCILWFIPLVLSGYGLIYLEMARPRLCYIYYGLVYLIFWTSICFSSNSLLMGFITITNAQLVLSYIFPLNLLMSFIYCLPLYRASSDSSFICILGHLLLFVLLTYLTLISAGIIWLLLVSI